MSANIAHKAFDVLVKHGILKDINRNRVHFVNEQTDTKKYCVEYRLNCTSARKFWNSHRMFYVDGFPASYEKTVDAVNTELAVIFDEHCEEIAALRGDELGIPKN
tara:strand:- start:81339 stop:81653 length:315 start_codon:yes stop_codon:yes gene_type:complete